MPDYQTDRQWSDKFITPLKHIIADLLIRPAPDAEDMQRNTDLIVFRVEALRVACRVRRFQYLQRYPNEFTIRAVRHNGSDTELAKLISGYGDYFVYAFANADETDLAAWRVINLSTFRLWFNQQLAKNAGRIPAKTQKNGDGSSDFYAFNVNDLPNTAIVREYGFPTHPTRI